MAAAEQLATMDRLLKVMEVWKQVGEGGEAVELGGCDGCRWADPFSDRLCTIPDISAEDFDLGVSGINCSRFGPRE